MMELICKDFKIIKVIKRREREGRRVEWLWGEDATLINWKIETRRVGLRSSSNLRPPSQQPNRHQSNSQQTVLMYISPRRHQGVFRWVVLSPQVPHHLLFWQKWVCIRTWCNNANIKNKKKNRTRRRNYDNILGLWRKGGDMERCGREDSRKET